MKRLIQKSLLIIPILVLGVSILLNSVARAAGTASLYLVPATGNYTTGSTLSIDIYEDSGSDSVNAVQANLSYDPNSLTFSSISSSAAFSTAYQSTGGGGTVQIARAAITPVTGPQVVATVRFTASAAGNTSISFAAGSSVVRSTDNQAEALTTSGGTYNITAPATPPPAPTPNPTPTPSPTPQPAPKPSPSPKQSTTPPPASPGTSPPPTSSSPTSSPTATPPPSTSAIEGPSQIEVSKVTGNTATISWTTSVPTTTELDYGPTNQYGTSVVDPKLVTNHNVVLSSKILLPGQTFHYQVRGVDASGKLIASGDRTFATAKAGAAKKSSSTGSIVAAVVVLGLLAAGGGAFIWVKNGGMIPQWSGYEPTAAPPPGPGAPAGQIVKPVKSTGEVKPGENIIKPGSGPTPPAPPAPTA